MVAHVGATELIVGLGSAIGLLGSLAGVLGTWLTKRKTRAIEVKIDGNVMKLDSTNVEQAEQIIKAFMQHVAADTREPTK